MRKIHNLLTSLHCASNKTLAVQKQTMNLSNGSLRTPFVTSSNDDLAGIKFLLGGGIVIWSVCIFGFVWLFVRTWWDLRDQCSVHPLHNLDTGIAPSLSTSAPKSREAAASSGSEEQ